MTCLSLICVAFVCVCVWRFLTLGINTIGLDGVPVPPFDLGLLSAAEQRSLSGNAIQVHALFLASV